jgi:hypothetical protein
VENPKGSGMTNFLILGILWVGGIVLNILNLEKLFHILEFLGYNDLKFYVCMVVSFSSRNDILESMSS